MRISSFHVKHRRHSQGAQHRGPKPPALTEGQQLIGRIMSRLWARPHSWPMRAIAELWGMTPIVARRLLDRARSGTPPA